MIDALRSKASDWPGRDPDLALDGRFMNNPEQVEVFAGSASRQSQASWIKWLNSLLALALTVAGIFSGSLALTAIAVFYIWGGAGVLMRSAAARLTVPRDNECIVLGYGRLEIATELASCVSVALLSASVAYLGVMHPTFPDHAQSWIIVVLVCVLMGIEVWMLPIPTPTPWRRQKMSTTKQQKLGRLAFLLPAFAGGVAMLATGSGRIDSIIAVFLSSLLLWFALGCIREVLRLSLLEVPPNLNASDVIREILSVEGVQDVHQLHFWRLAEQRLAIDAHVVVTVTDWQKAEAIRDHIEAMLIHKFGVQHSTLEMETPDREKDSCHAYGC